MRTDRHLRAVAAEHTATPSGPGEAAASFRGSSLAHTDAIAVHPAEQLFENITPEDFDRAVNLWGWFRTGKLDAAAVKREIRYLECGVPPCDSCLTKAGIINDGGWKTCGTCFNGGSR